MFFYSHKNACSVLIYMALLAFTLSFSFVHAQIRDERDNNAERLEQIKKQIEETSERAQNFENEAKTISLEISKIQNDLVKSAAEIQSIEDEISMAEVRLKELRSTEAELENKLKEKKFEMATTLGAMQRLSVQKTNVVAFKPDEAINTLRTTSLLKVILPDLRERAYILEGDISELNNVREDITQESIELRNDLTKLVISNNEIDELLKKRQTAQKKIEQSTVQERAKLKSFAENANDLQDLIEQIEKDIALREEAARRAEADLRDKPNSESEIFSINPLPNGNELDFASAKGNLPLPARGTINQVFDQLTSTGQRSKGITIETRIGATVISPHDGRIVYAGKFRSYGLLLIISHGEGYHTLLAGMENINGIVGQWILKGEPVGQMTTNENAPSAQQRLYVEFRQKGKPINPIPWIVASDRKVIG